MNEERTNYGKIIAITLAVIAACSAVAFLIYKLCRQLITFCHAYRELDEEPLDIELDELDEEPSCEEADETLA